MRIHLEATAAELADKGGRLVEELARALADDAPDLSKALEAAQEAVTRPHPSPHPALEELLAQGSAVYARRLQQMIEAIGAVLDRAPEAEKSLPQVDGWAELDEGLGEQLWAMLDLGDSADAESLEKAGAAMQGQPKPGHKYLRRVPYTGTDGKRRWRYYYTTQALGRQAQAGETVRMGDKHSLEVVEVGKNGQVTFDEEGEGPIGDREETAIRRNPLAPTGKEDQGAQKRRRTVSAEEWSQVLGRHFGQEVVDQAIERRAMQAVRAVTRTVPADLLQELQGETDEERMEDLQRRVPAVYDKLQKAFKRAGVGPWHAKMVISRSLQRLGWEDPARAAAIGSVLTPEGAQLARRHLQLLDAAENLAGGRKVRARHVQAAAEIMQGSPEKFAKAVSATAERAEAELVRLHQLLKLARQGGDQEAGQLLQAALSSSAVKDLLELAQAFPGLQDRAIPVAQQIMAQIPAVAPRKTPSTHGAKTNVFVAGDGGRPKAVSVQYRLVEADEIQASHEPGEGFRPNAKYPKGVQERVYHRDKAEQLKVLRNAQQLNPAFVANTNPDAVNGPPLVTADGVVLGGNSRTMSMQVAYGQHPGKAQEYKDFLAEHAHEFGLKDSDVHALKHPILVRVCEVQDSSERGLQLLVRQFNESFTQAMDPRTMQIALGKKVDDATISDMASSMREDESLGEFLSSSRAEAFVQALRRTGVIDDRNSNQFVRKGTMHLNEDGKTLVSRMLVGRLVGDADIMAEIRPKALDAVANATPFLLMATQSGKKYDLGPSLRTALDALNVLQNRVDEGTIKPLDSKIPENQLRALTENFLSDMFGGRHPLLEDERARALLDVLVRRPGPQQMAKVFREYARLARQNPEGQGSLLGGSLTPEQVFKQSIVSAGKKETAEAEAAKAPKEKEPKIIKRRVAEEEEPAPAPAGPTAEEQPGFFSLDARPGSLEDLAKAGGQPPAHAGGPFIGPRGGKWADPEMTIPWDPEQHSQTSIFEFKPPPGARSAADKPAKMMDPLVRALAQTEEKIRKLDVEHVHFLGKEGEAVVPPLKGDRDSCRIMGDVLNKVREHGDVVFTHNHPDNLCFSREDIFLAVNFNMKEIRAVTKAGVFVMHRPEGGWLEKGQVWKDVLEPVQGAYSAGHDKASDVMISRMEEASKTLPGNPPADENHPDYSEEKWNGILAAEQFKAFRRDLGGRFGWKFTFEPAGAPNAGGGGEARPGAGQAQAKAPPQAWEGQQQGLLKAGGPYVGPKGGLWEDPQHTRHWDPKEHQGAQLGLFGARAPAAGDSAQQVEAKQLPADVRPEQPADAGVAERPKPAEEPSSAANGGPAPGAPVPTGERERWWVTEINDRRPIDFLSGKRVPLEEDAKSLCARCGKRHQIIYAMESSKGRSAQVGSGCGPAMAGGAEFLDAKSVLEAKKRMEKEARDQHLQRALRWLEETTGELSKRYLPGVVFPAVEEVVPTTPAGFEPLKDTPAVLRTTDGLAKVYLHPHLDRAERLKSLKQAWVDALARKVVKEAETPWPAKWPKKAPGINAQGAMQDRLRAWIVHNVLPELEWKAPQ